MIDSHLQEISLIGQFFLNTLGEVSVTVLTTILVWVVILFFFKLCVKTIKKIIG